MMVTYVGVHSSVVKRTPFFLYRHPQQEIFLRSVLGDAHGLLYRAAALAKRGHFAAVENDAVRETERSNSAQKTGSDSLRGAK